MHPLSIHGLSRLLLSLPKSVRLDAAVVKHQGILLMIRAVGAGANCSRCMRRSTRVHSSYGRSLDDVQPSDLAIKLELVVRRFRCDNPECKRSIFAERFDGLVAPRARRTERCHRRMVDTGMAVGGEAGVRLLRKQGVAVSADTILRALRAEPCVAPVSPRAIGVDEFALRRGHRYGTVIVDLERRKIIDILPTRDTDVLADWLRAHPGVQFVARDRAEVYAEGARQGAPDAVQIADRWHLLKNVGDALERVLLRDRSALADAMPANEIPVEPERILSVSAETVKQRQQQQQGARQQLYDEVHRLANSGVSIHQITRTLETSRATIRKYLRAKQCPTRSPRRTPINSMGRFDEHLRGRWNEGEHNALVLHSELRALGYRGGVRSVQRHVAAWVTTKARARRGRRSVGDSARPAPARPPSPKQAKWWLTLPAERLTSAQQDFVAAVIAKSPVIAEATRLSKDFAAVLQSRTSTRLDDWLVAAEGSTSSEFRELAASLRRDMAAVQAAVTLSWSNGQTEGQVNKIKMFKRQMFGRAKVDLLRARLLHAV